MSVLDQTVIAVLPLVPRPIMRRLSARYIAGETLREAIAVLEQQRVRGFGGVLDILGEDVASAAAARDALDQYRAGASALKSAALDAYVSVKPTHFGLRMSFELALELYSTLATHCQELGQFLRVEMEDHTTTDDTLRLFHELRKQHDNVGIVLQARLFRTLDDIDALGAKPVDVRIVKGIYLEPARIAHTDFEPIRAAFVACTDRLLANGHKVACATHDAQLASTCLELVDKHARDKHDLYFEVLLGVQEPLWNTLRDGGSLVRVYVPYGPEWRAYSQRRLKHNPQILRHVMKNFLTPG